MWPSEDDWRATVPGLIERYREQWGLTVETTYPGGSAGRAMAVRTAAGEPAVLKLSLPHREARDEALALRWWGGDGAIAVLAHDPADPFAVLLERCEPGTPLAERDDLPAVGRLEVAAGLMRRLWDRGVPGDGRFESLGVVTAEWADQVERRLDLLRPPYDHGLVAEGVRLLRELPAGAAREVVVHGDLNPGNVLAATREPWLVIDPKPMVGDPGYDLSPLLLQVDDPFGHPDPAGVVRDRVAHLADVTGEPADRLLAWTLARMVEAALWYADRDEVDQGAAELGRARVVAGLS